MTCGEQWQAEIQHLVLLRTCQAVALICSPRHFICILNRLRCSAPFCPRSPVTRGLHYQAVFSSKGPWGPLGRTSLECVLETRGLCFVFPIWTSLKYRKEVFFVLNCLWMTPLGLSVPCNLKPFTYGDQAKVEMSMCGRSSWHRGDHGSHLFWCRSSAFGGHLRRSSQRWLVWEDVCYHYLQLLEAGECCLFSLLYLFHYWTNTY